MSVIDRIKFTAGGVPTQFYAGHNDIGLKLAPPLDPRTGNPIDPSFFNFMAPSLVEQEMTSDIFVDIPEPVLEVFAKFRPTPLVRATKFEKALGTKSRIYYKYEGATPLGSHKINSALAQAYFAKKDGAKRLTTETGGGQWGTALAFSANYFDLEALVYMVKCSYESKPVRRVSTEMYNGKIYPSPSDTTEAGRNVLANDPHHPGSLGLAISEAVEVAMNEPDTFYVLGSVLNHVIMHQTVIGLEAMRQLRQLGEYPDDVIACHGGGVNFGGLTAPFITENVQKGRNIKITAVEPESCASLTQGEFRYDYPDAAQVLPKIKMYTLGNEFVPSPIHAGGLRYHGSAPIVAEQLHQGLINAVALPQDDTFSKACLFAQCEGIVPAPESSHAVAQAAHAAKQADAEGVSRTILFGMSGTGMMEMAAYADHINKVRA